MAAMIRIAKAISAVAAALLVGCAHPISITPDTTRLAIGQDPKQRIEAKAAYQVSDSDLSLEVTTPGGGGDAVRYFAYRDMDAGLEQMLGTVFTHVSRSSDAQRAATGTDYVIVPVIVTNSGSDGLFTWPPSNFTVDLTLTIRRPSGEIIASPRVVGHGNAADGERIFDHGIAGRRATEDALIKMKDQLHGLNLSKRGLQSSGVPELSPLN